jgi:hypothetical protein
MAAAFSMASCAPATRDRCGDGIGDRDGDLGVLMGFRAELHGCLTVRGDELFELSTQCCAPTGRSRHVDLALAPEHQRGHARCTRG